MSTDNLVHKAGLAHGFAAETLKCRGHDAKADCSDLREKSEVGSANIDKVAELATLYAAGTPSGKDFAVIKEKVNVTGDQIEVNNNDAHIGSKEWSGGLTRDPNTRCEAFDQHMEMAREESDFSAGLRAMESSIRVFPGSSVSNRTLTRGRTSRTLALFFVAALIGVGATFAWHSQGDETREMARRWALSLDQLLTKSPPEPVAASTSLELARPEAVAPDPAVVPHTAEQPAAGQKQMYPDIATGKGVEQDTRSKTSSPPPHFRSKRTPVPETRPTTIKGWMLREVSNGTAILEGPNGIYTVKRGDTVPGVGRVKSVVLWGKRWIVATDRGLISTP